MIRIAIVLAIATLLSAGFAAAQPVNLCPNPGAEEGQGDTPAGGWYVEAGQVTWAGDQVHSGTHSFKVVNTDPKQTVGWVSPMIPVPAGGGTLIFSFWARYENVSGENGAYATFYHTDEQGKRIGQSGGIGLGGNGPTPASMDWRQFTTVANLTPEVKGVRVNMRLYQSTGTAWFDDVVVFHYQQGPLEKPAAVRRGLRLKGPDALAIVSAEGADEQAKAIQQALATAGCTAPVIAPGQVDLKTDARDLIVLGNLKTSAAIAYLYCQSYTFEDLYYPGPGGYVLRPLVNPTGTGGNLLVVGASDGAGLKAATEALVPLIAKATEALDVPLTTKKGEGYKGTASFPYFTDGPRKELSLVAAYLKTGDMAAAQKYREMMLQEIKTPDEQLFATDNSLHLVYQTTTQAWDLMWADPVFSDEERLAIDNYLLKIMRSPQGYDFGGLSAGMFSRENHATRAGMGFYYGWRHFAKCYRPQLSFELNLWRAKLRDFWAACFAGFRPYEDSLSQHALGGSMDNTLSIALMEPEWAQEFVRSGRARLMGERAIAISNNLGQTVLLGDTGMGDYAASVFAKLAYMLNDGRYLYMIDKRGMMVSSTTDEPFRGFAVGIKPVPPEDHVGLAVISPDDLYFRSAISTRDDVDMAKAFDKLSMRSGFGVDDEYLMIDGVAGGSHSYDDANSLGEFSANGRRWLCEIDIFNGPTMSFHNAVTVAREGLGDPRVPQAAELVASEKGSGWAYTATRLPKYNNTAWTRHVLWQPGKYTCVFDEMTAEQPGDYSFVLGWRSLGKPTLQSGVFETAQDDVVRPTIFLDGGELASAVSASSGKFYYHLADYNAVLCRSEQPGDFLEVPLEVAKADAYKATVETLNYTGRGIMQVRLDGQPLGQPIDVYKDGSPQLVTTALGQLQLAAGRHLLRFEITGRNPASKGSFMAISGFGLQRVGEAPRQDLAENRFRLIFPSQVPATLDRDTEVLGKYLPPSNQHDAALNIVEQSMSAALQPGQSACFQNVLQARKGAAPEVQLRRLAGHCALIKRGDEIALVGMEAHGAGVQLGPLQASGQMYFVSSERLLLHEAQVSLNGKLLAADAKPPAELRQVLGQAWERAGKTTSTAAPPPWQKAPRLQPEWQAELPAKPLSVTSRATANGQLSAVGLADGQVRQFTAAGAPNGDFTTAGPVHALHAVDLDGDKSQELLVGSDDTFIYALDRKLQTLWKHEMPFRAEVNLWLWWTLDTAKVRRIASGDINGDSRPELLLGCGNMHLECLDSTGQELWHYRTDHGICTTITTADVFSDGHQRVVAGNGLTSDTGDCRVFDESGKLLQRYFNGSWCTALPAIAVGDLDGDGQQTIFCGNNRGDLRAYAPRSAYSEPLWIRNLTRPVRSLTILGAAGQGLVVVGSDSGYLCAFNQKGEKAWGLPVSSAVVQTELVHRGGEAVVAAACKDGKVFIVSPDGKLLGLFETVARTEDMGVADLNGDGRDELLLITSDPHRLWAVEP